jgi:hypothetical protein
MSRAKVISPFLVFIFLSLFSCSNTHYPCPAYNESGNKNVSMKVGPDGTPISSVDRQFDENGLVKKKKVKKLHK